MGVPRAGQEYAPMAQGRRYGMPRDGYQGGQITATGISGGNYQFGRRGAWEGEQNAGMLHQRNERLIVETWQGGPPLGQGHGEEQDKAAKITKKKAPV